MKPKNLINGIGLSAAFIFAWVPDKSYGENYALLPPEYSGAPYEIGVPKNNCAWINPGIDLREGLNYKFRPHCTKNLKIWGGYFRGEIGS